MKEKQDFSKEQITDRELVKYEGDCSKERLAQKIARYGKLLGAELLYKAVELWYVLQKPDVPASTKALITGALGYLIAPLDFIPDLTPALGYSDDIVAISFALLKVQGYIDEEVEEKSRKLLSKFLAEETVGNLL